MPRRTRSHVIGPLCYHITQRCQERRFLFQWKRDRQQYLKRLRQMIRRYPVSVLSYIVTGRLPSNSYELEPAVAGVAEDQATYMVRMSNRRRESLLFTLG